MADELRETWPEERRLERKKAAQPVERRFDLRNPSRLPRPYLRTDDVNGPDTLLFRVGREFEIHPGIIYRADDIGLPVVDRPFHRLLDVQEISDARYDRHKSHNGEIRRLKAVVAVPANFVTRQKFLETVGVDKAGLFAR